VKSYILLLILLLGACTNTEFTPSKLQQSTCQQMAGNDSQLFKPNEEQKRELESIIPDSLYYRGVIWFSGKNGVVYACAYTNDKNGCGTKTFELKQSGQYWQSELVSSLEDVCVVG